MTVTDHPRTDTETDTVCRLDDLVPERGAGVLVGSEQVAIFRIDDEMGTRVYAVDNHDPFGQANVLARGIVGQLDGRWYVASPLHKQRFDLATGACLDDADVRIRTWPVEIADGDIRLGA